MAYMEVNGKVLKVREPRVGMLVVTPEGDVLRVTRIWASLPDQAEVETALDDSGHPILVEHVPDNTPAALPLS